MGQEKLLTIREASHYLNVSEKEIITLAEAGKIPAYKVGGVYLRFKRDQLDKAKSLVLAKYGASQVQKATWFEKIRDFFYFNDFYILSAMVIAVIAYVILQG